MRNHVLNLPLREVTSVNLVLTQLVKEWFLPNIVLNIMEELFLLIGGQVIWNDP